MSAHKLSREGTIHFLKKLGWEKSIKDQSIFFLVFFGVFGVGVRKLACEEALRGALAAVQHGGKRKESLQLVDAKCWLAEMTLVMTSLPLARVFQCLFTFALDSASRSLAEIWRLNRRGATEDLEAEFKFQRRSCKFSFLSPPRRQSAPGSLLAGYEKISVGHSTLWNLTLTQFLNITAESELLLSMTIPGLSTSLTCLSSCTSCMLL